MPRLSRFAAVVAAAMLVGALLPATALAAKPGPSWAFSTCEAVAKSDMAWTVTATGSWSGQPGGTTPGAFAYALNGTTRTDGVRDVFEVTGAGRGSAYFSASFTINSWDAGGTASTGGYVVVGLGFYGKNGTLKASAETTLSWCPRLPELMPS